MIFECVVMILIGAFLFFWPVISIPRYKKYLDDYENNQKQKHENSQQNPAYLLEKKIAEKYLRSTQHQIQLKQTVTHRKRSLLPCILSFIAMVVGCSTSLWYSIRIDADKLIISVLIASVSLAVFIAETKIEHRFFKDDD